MMWDGSELIPLIITVVISGSAGAATSMCASTRDTGSLYSGPLEFTVFWVTQLSVIMGTWYNFKLKIKLTLFWLKHVEQAYTIRWSGMGIIMFEVCAARFDQSGVNEVWLLLSYYCHHYYIRYECNFIV